MFVEVGGVLATEGLLRGAFSQFGPIHSVKVTSGGTVAFITFNTVADASAALKEVEPFYGLKCLSVHFQLVGGISPVAMDFFNGF